MLLEEVVVFLLGVDGQDEGAGHPPPQFGQQLRLEEDTLKIECLLLFHYRLGRLRQHHINLHLLTHLPPIFRQHNQPLQIQPIPLKLKLLTQLTLQLPEERMADSMRTQYTPFE